MQRIASVQILRFVAASMVVLVHSARWNAGCAGVDIFFVLSGFVIATVLPRSTLSGFVRGRLTRIFPIYWLCLAIKLAEVIPRDGWSINHAFVSLTLWPVTPAGFTFPDLFVGWTLCFELLFYGAAALTLISARAKSLLLAGYAVALAGAFLTGWALFRYLGNPIILEFLAGVMLAQLPRTKHAGAGGLALALGAGLILIAPVYGAPESVIDLTEARRALLWGIPAAMIVWGALQFEPKGRVADALSYGGDASYSIYLFHFLVMWHLLPIMPWPAAAVLTVALGIAVHRYVEAPMLKWVRSLRHYGGGALQRA